MRCSVSPTTLCSRSAQGTCSSRIWRPLTRPSHKASSVLPLPGGPYSTMPEHLRTLMSTLRVPGCVGSSAGTRVAAALSSRCCTSCTPNKPEPGPPPPPPPQPPVFTPSPSSTGIPALTKNCAPCVSPEAPTAHGCRDNAASSKARTDRVTHSSSASVPASVPATVSPVSSPAPIQRVCPCPCPSCCLIISTQSAPSTASAA
mmetsp:Transcript_35224/g.78255  ORF Transcript_35224/g.78255 Transcript_35224/m.78255 type:complete len:202 (-) Transcript_35224:1120-1725(-)